MKEQNQKQPKCKYCYDKGHFSVAEGGSIVRGDFVGDQNYIMPLEMVQIPCRRCSTNKPSAPFAPPLIMGKNKAKNLNVAALNYEIGSADAVHLLDALNAGPTASPHKRRGVEKCDHHRLHHERLANGEVGACHSCFCKKFQENAESDLRSSYCISLQFGKETEEKLKGIAYKAENTEKEKMKEILTDIVLEIYTHISPTQSWQHIFNKIEKL